MTLDEIAAEMRRVQAAIDRSSSEYLRKDYRKYLRKLQKQLEYMIRNHGREGDGKRQI